MSQNNNKKTTAKTQGANTSGKKRLTKEQRKKKKQRRIILIAIELFILVLMLIALYIVVLYGKMDHQKLDDESIVINAGIDEKELDLNKEDIETNKGLGSHMQGYWNIALFGLDARDKSLGKGNRSDTIIIASINKETKEVKLVSVYRDTYLNLGNDSYNKANSAYAKGGPLQAINMLNMNLDMNITDYMTVGWAGVADTIDALGGVDIEVDEAEINHLNNYQVETSKSLGRTYNRVTSTGMQTLDGIQAVSYCRIRYTAGDDFKRTERQREVIQAILDKAKKANVITLNNAANKILEEVSTSLSATEILDLVADVNSYSIGETGGFPAEQYRTTGDVPGKGSCVMTTNLTDDVLYLHQFLFGDVSDYQPSSQVQTISQKIHSDTGK